MIEFYVRGEVLAAIKLFAATADIRTYLNGVCFEVGPSEVRLIATDGVMLGVFRVEYEPPAFTDTVFQAIVPLDLLRNVKGKGPVLVALGEPEGEDNTRRVEVTPAGCATTVGRTITGRYPDYRRFIPAKVSGKTAQFNLWYLETLAKAYRALRSAKSIPAIGIGHNGQDVALLTLDDEDFVGVLMPLRKDACAVMVTAPAWVHDCTLATTLATPDSVVNDLV